MHVPHVPVSHPHARWSPGAWFGSQVGSTLWMLLLFGALVGEDRVAAATSLGAFVACNALGAGLWMRRERAAFFSSIQLLVIAMGFASIIVFVVVNRAVDRGAVELHAMALQRLPYWALLIHPLLLLQFQGLKKRAERCEQTPPG